MPSLPETLQLVWEKCKGVYIFFIVINYLPWKNEHKYAFSLDTFENYIQHFSVNYYYLPGNGTIKYYIYLFDGIFDLLNNDVNFDEDLPGISAVSQSLKWTILSCWKNVKDLEFRKYFRFFGCICTKFSCVFYDHSNQIDSNLDVPFEQLPKKNQNRLPYLTNCNKSAPITAENSILRIQSTFYQWEFYFQADLYVELDNKDVEGFLSSKSNTSHFVFCNSIYNFLPPVFKCFRSKIQLSDFTKDNPRWSLDVFDQDQKIPSIVINVISLVFITVSLIIVASSESLRRNMHGSLLISLLVTMALDYLHYFHLVFRRRSTKDENDLSSFEHLAYVRTYFILENAFNIWITVVCYDIWCTLR
jgi:hypothetical protein